MSQDVRSSTSVGRSTEWQAYEATDAELREQVNRRLGKGAPSPSPWHITWRWFDVPWMDEPAEPAWFREMWGVLPASVFRDSAWHTAVHG